MSVGSESTLIDIGSGEIISLKIHKGIDGIFSNSPAVEVKEPVPFKSQFKQSLKPYNIPGLLLASQICIECDFVLGFSIVIPVTYIARASAQINKCGVAVRSHDPAARGGW